MKKKDGLMRFFFYYIWHIRTDKRCAICGKPLKGEISSTYFDHLLEKSKYPEIKYLEDNILLVCPDHHTDKTNGFPHPTHKKAIDKFYKKYIKNKEYYIQKNDELVEEILKPLKNSLNGKLQ